MTAYVVAADPVHENAVNYFSAALGLYRLGYFVERYDLANLPGFEIDGDTPVFGGIESIHAVLPAYSGLPYYPQELSEHLFRSIEERAIGDVQAGEFFKPLEQDHKLFSPRVLDDSFESELLISRIPPETTVLTSPAVDFDSEFRVYVLNGEVLDICRYKGDPMKFPATDAIREMVTKCSHYAAAFGLDVGVTSDGHTAVVELNDFCCLGNYGLRATDYARCIVARWSEVWSQFSLGSQQTEQGEADNA